ncbi:MAG: hypothetical protein H5T41_11045 [Methanomassiliicoccales archaeon]|nr:hypothetical protein [Methanomassiliicoccales archaeon]
MGEGGDEGLPPFLSPSPSGRGAGVRAPLILCFSPSVGRRGFQNDPRRRTTGLPPPGGEIRDQKSGERASPLWERARVREAPHPNLLPHWGRRDRENTVGKCRVGVPHFPRPVWFHPLALRERAQVKAPSSRPSPSSGEGT